MGQLIGGSDNVRIYARSEWAARQPRATSEQPSAPREAFIHHSADSDAPSLVTLAAQERHMRETQNFHMDDPDRRWSDIAYHFVIFQPHGNLNYARIFEARDWHKVPAAQLGHNTGTLAICVVGDFRTEVLKRNTRYAIELLLKNHSAARAVQTVGGHRDVVQTDCPGKELYRWVPRIADAAGLKVFKR